MSNEYRFVENRNTPEIFIHHLHDVQFIDGVAVFIPVQFRIERDQKIGEQAATVIMAQAGVEPALCMTWERLPNGVFVPALGRFVRRALSLN